MPANDEQITHCKWCDRVAQRDAGAPAGVWTSRKAWQARAGRLVGPLRHGICPECLAAMLRQRSKLVAEIGSSAARDRIDGMEAFRLRRNRDAQLHYLVERRLCSAPANAAARTDEDRDAAFAYLQQPGIHHRYDNRAAYNRLRAILGLLPTPDCGK